MSTIETATGCKITVGPKGLALWDRSAHLIGYELSTPLTADERRALADALAPERDFSGVDWKVMYTQARSERDAAVYAYDKAERERDEWKQEHDLLVVHGSVRGDTYAAMVRDRDDWRDKAYSASEGMRKAVARAEAAEARLADPYSQTNQDAAAWNRVAAHPALSMDLLPEADHTYAGGVLERITWLAEAAEARTSPAVTRADINKAIRDTLPISDPDGMWAATAHAQTQEVCALLGIEAEQAADPVEELAGQIETATRAAIRQVCDDLADVVPSLDPLTVERAMEVTAASRKVAAHILGQEAEQ